MTSAMMLIDVAVILVAAKAAGHLARRLGQPAVVGEITAGVVLAAVLRGSDVTAAMLSADVRGALHAIATVGLVLFMFTVGFEWDRRLMRGRGRATAGVAVGASIVPFALGAVLALWLATRYAPVDPVAFVLFVGTAMSITALPVLARIVTDRGLAGTAVGGVAIAAAAAADVVGWALLAVIVVMVGGGTGWQLLFAVPYLVGLFALRPLLTRLLRRWSGKGGFGSVLAALFLSAATTEWLGMHFVFGAFVFGALLSGQDGGEALRQHVDELVRLCHAFLLPVFFVVAALDVDLTGLGVAGLVELAVILVVAVAGKLAGAYLGARVGGMRTGAAAVAVLMNARGVTEIVVLQVGLQLGVLAPRLYSVMVVMALVTTALTGPLLALIGRRAKPAPEPDRRPELVAGEGGVR
jgi:Kef-type K+ transport system membrane component KefB